MYVLLCILSVCVLLIFLSVAIVNHSLSGLVGCLVDGAIAAWSGEMAWQQLLKAIRAGRNSA